MKKQRYKYIFYYNGKRDVPAYVTIASSFQQALRFVAQKNPNVYKIWDLNGFQVVRKPYVPSVAQPSAKPVQLTFKDFVK